MWIIELLVVLVFIFLGARLGSIGIGFAGGLGVLVLALVLQALGIIALLLLNVMGIDLTALAVFSGALGVGLTVLGAAYGIGKLASSAVESMARQPEVTGVLVFDAARGHMVTRSEDGSSTAPSALGSAVRARSSAAQGKSAPRCDASPRRLIPGRPGRC